ncbi:hypothetical protein [Caproiciproducens galactitolivorans]|uniref:Uncharacterized protein n=1 Tax=Caproiciproducens galactitolivorans TaxID=642589 RepID=A0ABT4BU03_9FIRM|nr:hypothetical protein [Caproiciproducens galactitolivorans]MCY1714382.1 hypothetical protein [Caproiciproducens galactitolivorans]
MMKIAKWFTPFFSTLLLILIWKLLNQDYPMSMKSINSKTLLPKGIQSHALNRVLPQAKNSIDYFS